MIELTMGVLVGMIVLLFTALVFQHLAHMKQLEKFTNKVLAKTYTEYANGELQIMKEMTKRKKPEEDKKDQRIRL